LEDECGDHFDILEPIPQGRKPCQSSFSFDFEDMASPYGGGSGEGMYRASLVQLAPLKLMTLRESLPCSVNSRSYTTPISTPTWYRGLCSVVWRVFRWRITRNLRPLTLLRSWPGGTITPQMVDPSSTLKDKEKKEEGKSEEEEQKLGDVVNPPPFNPTS
jgi:hypothetical protein